MEYSTADYLTGLGQKSFIAELMPHHPVYVNLLPATARDAIGAVHADTLPAKAMLEQEGFRYEGYVDIFDADPRSSAFATTSTHRASRGCCPSRSATTIRCRIRRPTTCRGWWATASSPTGGRSSPPHPRGRIACRSCRAAGSLGVKEGDLVRAVPLSPRDR